MLRQEVYALDGSDKEGVPYTVTEQNFTIRAVQPRGGNRHGVFFTHAREAISYHYERNPADPRIGHALTLEVDEYGNVLKSAAIGYGRRQRDPDLSAADQARQEKILITYTENRVTNAFESAADHRTPLPWESCTYELTELPLPVGRNRFTLQEILEAGATALPLAYEASPTAGRLEKRRIEHLRTLYRRDDLDGPLPLGEVQALALPFESYRLAFTPGLLRTVFQRPLDQIRPPGAPTPEDLLPIRSDVLPVDPPATEASDRGGYRDLDGDGHWWIPSGQVFYSPGSADTAAEEAAYARGHFFLPHRYRDPFHTDAFSTESHVDYDGHDLLVRETRDALENRVSVAAQDYRVLQPALIVDPNGNRSAVAFDALGMVVGTAVMGKAPPAPMEGDSLAGFAADLTPAERDPFFDVDDPHSPGSRSARRLPPRASSTTSTGFHRTRGQIRTTPTSGSRPVAATIARETHVSDLADGEPSRLQLSFSYSDGFGREIQKKIQAEPGPVPQRDRDGQILLGPDDLPLMTPYDVSPRWVGSGWTVFNNKGKPVRQYEPFFSDTHRFESRGADRRQPGAVLRPGRTGDRHPASQPHLGEGGLRPLAAGDLGRQRHPAARARRPTRTWATFPPPAEADYLPTWYALRTEAAHAAVLQARYPDAADQSEARRRPPRRRACTLRHRPSPTPTPSAGPFLTIAHNRFKYSDRPPEEAPVEECHETRVLLDIEGNQREVIDAKDRVGHALPLRHARQPHPPGQHGGRRALDAERRGRQAALRLGRPRASLPHRLRPAAAADGLRPERRRRCGEGHRAPRLWRKPTEPGGRQPARQAHREPRPGRHRHQRPLRLQGQSAAQQPAVDPDYKTTPDWSASPAWNPRSTPASPPTTPSTAR